MKILAIIFLLLSRFTTAHEEKNILITGCGRSGTTFTTALLIASGIDVKHERPGSPVTIAWPMVGQAYTPFLEDDFGEPPHFDVVLHQVRNPLHVITSWLINLPEKHRGEWQFIRFHTPEIHEEDSLLVHCVKYWIYWNLKAETIAHWRYRIEDIEEVLPELEQFLGIKLNPNALSSVPKNLNKWNSTEEKISWEYLREELIPSLYEELVLLSIRYGYKVSELQREL